MGGSCCSAQCNAQDKEITIKSKSVIQGYSISLIKIPNSIHTNSLRGQVELSEVESNQVRDKSVSIVLTESEVESSQQVIDLRKKQEQSAVHLFNQGNASPNKNKRFLMMLE